MLVEKPIKSSFAFEIFLIGWLAYLQMLNELQYIFNLSDKMLVWSAYSVLNGRFSIFFSFKSDTLCTPVYLNVVCIRWFLTPLVRYSYWLVLIVKVREGQPFLFRNQQSYLISVDFLKILLKGSNSTPILGMFVINHHKTLSVTFHLAFKIPKD